LSATQRPVQVGAWIKCARPWAVYDVGNPRDFGTAWWGWWVHVQPADRGAAGRAYLEERGEARGVPVCSADAFPLGPIGRDSDWHKVAIAGKNGLLSVMVSLSWWGAAVKAVGGDPADWTNAVTDVAGV
ncbi:hypothetical protein BV25DRAFT_1789530, partial [Artomyces pyxidatus]